MYTNFLCQISMTLWSITQIFASCMKFPLYSICIVESQLWPTLPLDTHFYYITLVDNWQMVEKKSTIWHQELQLLYKMILANRLDFKWMTVDLCVTLVYWKLLLIIMFYLLWELYSIDNSSMLLFTYMHAHAHTHLRTMVRLCITMQFS